MIEKYRVYVTEPFEDLFDTLDNTEQIWIEKIMLQLAENPTGKILRFEWFREKKYLNKRLYYLIDKSTNKILLISFASKKEQQKIIDYVISQKNEFFSLLRTL